MRDVPILGKRSEVMTTTYLRRLTSALIIGSAFVMTSSGRGHADVKPGGSVSKPALQAKVAYCNTCHGFNGQGFRAFQAIPRLAGQQPEYLKNQLQAFIERRRTNNIMFNVAHVLSPEMLEALTANFNGLDPKPLGGAPRNLVAEGKTIFEEGVPKSDIPPCASCHGADGKGRDQFPRLAGQLNDYIFSKLTNWTKERGQIPAQPDSSAIMEPFTHGLTASQIKAVAAYVSYLE